MCSARSSIGVEIAVDGGYVLVRRVFGEISGMPVGTHAQTRKEMSELGIHRPLVAGICGDRNGTESVVLSGGFEDDQDNGDEVVYTGQGGNSEQGGGGVQTANQQWTRGNAGLVRNWSQGWRVRLVRGARLGPPFAPSSGYRYDGLYRVDAYGEATGISGFKVCQYRLVRDDVMPAPWSVDQSGMGVTPPERRTVTIQRIVRSTTVADRVKKSHDYACQICGIRLEIPGGVSYAEAAHVRGLGAPHFGPDVEENILCLCPNHHVLFDSGALTINDDLILKGYKGRLRTSPEHPIEPSYLAYHREHAAKS